MIVSRWSRRRCSLDLGEEEIPSRSGAIFNNTFFPVLLLFSSPGINHRSSQVGGCSVRKGEITGFRNQIRSRSLGCGHFADATTSEEQLTGLAKRVTQSVTSQLSGRSDRTHMYLDTFPL